MLFTREDLVLAVLEGNFLTIAGVYAFGCLAIAIKDAVVGWFGPLHWPRWRG